MRICGRMLFVMMAAGAMALGGCAFEGKAWVEATPEGAPLFRANAGIAALTVRHVPKPPSGYDRERPVYESETIWNVNQENDKAKFFDGIVYAAKPQGYAEGAPPQKLLASRLYVAILNLNKGWGLQEYEVWFYIDDKATGPDRVRPLTPIPPWALNRPFAEADLIVDPNTGEIQNITPPKPGE